jgi:hypothetical protein
MTAPNYEHRTIPEMASRGFWMMIGPMLLVPLTFKVIEHGNGWLTTIDFVFLGTLAAMVLARGFEFYKGHPLTVEGQPATTKHFQRFVMLVAGAGLGVWVMANVVGNYVIPGFRAQA